MKTRVVMMAVALILVTAANGEQTMVTANRQKLTAGIKHVTVFTNGAQVERSHAVNLTAGEHVITFTGLSPYTDVKSMQIKARGKLTVLGVNYRTTHPDSLQRVSQLRGCHATGQHQGTEQLFCSGNPRTEEKSHRHRRGTGNTG